MAERWIPRPEAPVGPKEPVGRRLFDEPSLVGADDQKPKQTLDLRHFEERRKPIEVSLDRLGEKGIDRKVLNFVTEIARRQGSAFKPAKRFNGWVYLKAEELARPPRGQSFPVQASPEKPDVPEDPGHNPYHAHVSGQDSHSVALHLQYLFSKYGKTRRSSGVREGGTGIRLRVRRGWTSMLQWFRRAK